MSSVGDPRARSGGREAYADYPSGAAGALFGVALQAFLGRARFGGPEPRGAERGGGQGACAPPAPTGPGSSAGCGHAESGFELSEIT